MSHRLVASLFQQLRTVFTTETLPLEQPSPARSRRSLLAVVFSAEQLPMDPEPPRRGSRWLSWLFVPERIDRGPNRPGLD
ncbi:MAG TPA: hypothetical protein VF341_06890 [Anaeromyxobacteraceae bacterium]